MKRAVVFVCLLSGGCGSSDFWTTITPPETPLQGTDAGVGDAGVGMDAGLLCHDPPMADYAPTTYCWQTCCILACKKSCLGYPHETSGCDQFCETNVDCAGADAGGFLACCPINGECHGYI
jgi:hypothetical protein